MMPSVLAAPAIPVPRTMAPAQVGVLHFIGIGGIGMSGIAEVMATLGYRVQGSDVAEGYNIARLRAAGIEVFIGHRAENLRDAAVVVVSTAIQGDNPEVLMARQKHIPIVRRAEMLAELMRFKATIAVAGTHGKTTTTSMVAAVLDKGGFDPTVINGGIINAYGTNARLGAGEWMVVEADESDGSFLRLPATLGIVTNIDPEHLDHYGDFEGVRAAFRHFIDRIPFYGAGILCLDHPEVQALVRTITDRRLITYGFNPQADVRATDVAASAQGARFNVRFYDRRQEREHVLEGLTLAMPGRHNVQNACAAIAIAHELGLPDAAIRAGLASFGGVKRRFTKTGEAKGVTIIDDYGHHPVEIKAVLSAARDVTQGKVVAVVQPHRYSRLRDLMADFSTCFDDADLVVIAPVYAAGEAALAGVDHDQLAANVRASGHRHVLTTAGAQDLPHVLKDHVKAGDYVVCLGAGDITKWAASLPQALEALL
jgi:UDP-N-acetylmuramate--alanine ligase